MARSRIIRPEFFTHEGLYEAERSTGLPLRLAFAGLWCVADREGRFEWKPRVLKLAILPYDDVDFEAVLSALESAGFILGYTLGEPGASPRFAFIPTFNRYQNPHPREAPSRVPAPPSTKAVPKASLGLTLGSPKDSTSPAVSVSVSTSDSVSVSTPEDRSSPDVAPRRPDGGPGPEGPGPTGESLEQRKARMASELRSMSRKPGAGPARSAAS